MFSFNDDINVNDEDIEYFNTNFRKIEDLDLLISQLEHEKANDLFNALTFISNTEDKTPPIDLLNNQLTAVSENSKSLLIREKSPFYPVIDYCKNKNEIYQRYEKILDFKKKLENFQDLTINNIDDAIEYMNQIQSSSVDAFNQWTTIESMSPSKFCKSLKIAKSFIINSRESENQNENITYKDKVNLVEQKLEFFHSKILHCTFNQSDPFAGFLFFGSYLLDPSNEQLFTQYFKNFTIEYYKSFYESSEEIKKAKLQKHTTTIIKIGFDIQKELEKHKEIDDDAKIVPIMRDNLVPLLIQRVPVAFKKGKIKFGLPYDNFTGSTFSSLKKYEDNYLIEFSKQIIESSNKDNINVLLQYQDVLKEVKNKVKIQDILKTKFENLKNLILEPQKIFSKNKDTKKFKKLLQLSQVITKLNNIFEYDEQDKFDDYKDEILKFAEKEAKRLMPFTDNFIQILSNKDPINQQIRDKFNDFLSNFTLDDKYLSIEKFEYDYIYQFTHSFLNCFYDKFKIYFLNAKDKEEAIQCGLKFTICLYSETKLFHSSVVDKTNTFYNEFKPKTYKNESDIYLNDNFSHDIIEQNKNNEQIPRLKRQCYCDLSDIINLCQN